MTHIPNPTENKMNISRNGSIERILLSNKGRSTEFLFSSLIGYPEGCHNYDLDYDIDKWFDYYDTDRDIAYDQIQFEIKESHIELEFISVLNPPKGFVSRLAEKYDCSADLCFRNEDDNYSGCFYLYKTRNGEYHHCEFVKNDGVLPIPELEKELNILRRNVSIEEIKDNISKQSG